MFGVASRHRMTTTERLVTIKGYRISSDLFQKGFPEGGGPCTCTSDCCHGGVYVDIGERERILAHRDLVKLHMDDSQVNDEAQWFEPQESEHRDFPSGRCVGTQEINGKCTFLDRKGMCSLQKAAVSVGMHKWALKPLYCILFPIEITDGVIGFDDLLQEESGCCSISRDFAVPMFKGCKEELIHLLGQDGYSALEEAYNSLQATALREQQRDSQ